MSKKMKKKNIAIWMIVALVLGSLWIPQNGAKEEMVAERVKTAQAADASVEADLQEFNDYDADTITLNMGAGWNLGNQLEANNNGTPYEAAWNNPVIKKETLEMVKNAGFSTIRIPVSYLNKIGAGTSYTIDAAWLNRVKEVVDYAYQLGLYVIINMHGDGYKNVSGSWLHCYKSASEQIEIKAKYAACWQQIATTFKDYDEHLVFESMNEEFDDTYGNPNKEYYSNINAYNQIFVDTVRQSGGNNAKRWLLIPGWNTNIDYTVGNYGFALPTDTHLSEEVASGEKRIMISVHYYDPWDFAGAGKDTDTQWGDNVTDSSKAASNSWGGKSFMRSQMQKLKATFTSKGYPVVIGEYGATDNSESDSQNLVCRKDYYKSLCTYAKQNGCVPVAWDNGGLGTKSVKYDWGWQGEQFGLFNRKTFQQTANGAQIINSIMEVYDEEAAKEAAVGRADAVIAEVNALTKDSYTAESWAKVSEALETLVAVKADAAATIQQIDSAIAALQGAKAALVPVSTETPPTEAPATTQPPATDPSSTQAPDHTAAPQDPNGGTVTPGQTTTPEQTTTPGSVVTEEPPEVGGKDTVLVQVKIKKVKSPSKKKLQVTWAKIKGVDGYQIKIGLNKKVTKKVKTGIVKKASVTRYTFKNCKRKKKYYAKVRAYVMNDGKRVYGPWSKTGKKAKVK